MKWKFEDAIMLKCIQISTSDNKTKSDFKTIFELFDELNHSVLTFENFKSSLEKLISVNFVEIDNENLTLTKHFLKEYAKLTDKLDSTNSTEIITIHNFLNKSDFKIQELCKLDVQILNKIRNARFEYLKE